MRKLSIILLPSLLLALLIFPSCTPSQVNGDVNVVASFYPVYIFTMNLIDGIESVSLSTIGSSSGGCLHDYQLTSKDMKTLTDSDIFIINGAGMEGFIEKAMSEVKNLNVADSSEGIGLIEGECTHSGEHDHEHEANSHIWLSVSNAVKQIDNICAALISLLPEQADRLAENRDSYITRLLSLDAEMKNALSGADAPVITFHSAYDYFAEEYGLNVLACIEADEGGEPSAKELTELAQLISQNGVKAIFVEPEYEGSAAEILASETGASVYTLNPITGGESVKSAYEDIMRANLVTLAEALA